MKNEPAFPVVAHWNCAQQDLGDGLVQFTGMTLRDWFAGQALIGILSSPIGKLPDLNGGENKQAWGAYVIADAMLAARGDQP